MTILLLEEVNALVERVAVARTGVAHARVGRSAGVAGECSIGHGDQRYL